MSDQERKYEAIIIGLGFTGPRITPAMIEELLDRVTYSTQVVPGTTTTLATAVAGCGFLLCTAEHHCPSPENFNPALGIEIAITKAKALARDRLWLLEEYRLSQALHESRKGSATQALGQIRAVLGRVEAEQGQPSPFTTRVRNLSRSLAATAAELCAGTASDRSVLIADAAIKAVEAAGGYGRKAAQAEAQASGPHDHSRYMQMPSTL